MLSSFTQQCISRWCKVNWLEKYLKFRPLAYLDSCQTSVMELFCEYRWLLSGVHHFYGNAPSYLFHRVLNVSLKSIWYSNCNVLWYLLYWTRVESKYPWNFLKIQGQITTVLMSENFQLHLIKCWYFECYYNQNLTVSNSPKLRGLFECEIHCKIYTYLLQLCSICCKLRCWAIVALYYRFLLPKSTFP